MPRLIALCFVFVLSTIFSLVAKQEFIPLDITPLLQGHDKKDAPQLHKINDVPFEIREGDFFRLAEVGWPEWDKDPSTFFEDYDAGKGIPLLQIPREDYSAIWLLARAKEGKQFTNNVTVRIGRRSGGAKNGQVKMFDFMGTVPFGNGQWQPIRIPLTEAFAQDIEGDILDVEITKEIRLAVRSPDPCRFRWRPLGLSSNVEIAAITMERSPLQVELTAATEGSLFVAPETPKFNAKIRNKTRDEQALKLEVLVDGKQVQTYDDKIPPGESIEKKVELPEQILGHHKLEIVVHNIDGKLFSRHAFFGVLPMDTRQNREESPIGTWQFHGDHFTSMDYNYIGKLYQKLGLRYGLFMASPTLRKEMGVLRGNEYAIRMKNTSGKMSLEGFEKVLAEHPDTLPVVLVFHEDSISGPHVTRTPDLFHDRPPYQLNSEEKKRFDEMVRIAIEGVTAIRAKYPNIKFSLGNGPLPMREEFYRNKFPKDMFDFAGNESGSFGRPPETQPPDIVANNASLWMDQELLKAYGYSDKPIYQCLEVIYPGTNPGNLSYQTQADYFVRHILHSMVWGMPRIRIGILADVGNSYYYSNWGSSSFFTAKPRMEPKPAAIAIATLTRVLDGAVYSNFIETGSDSAYLLNFKKLDNSHILPHWVIHGTRDFQLKLEGNVPPSLQLIAGDGVVMEVPVQGSQVTFTSSSTPGYLELPAGVSVTSVSLGKPIYKDAPLGKITHLSSLSSMDGWKIETKRNPKLELYNPMTPRRKGNFSFGMQDGVINIKPLANSSGKPTMPMYVELVNEEGIALPGHPTEVGLWVDGNSSWGRIIFELEDASGQRWTSIGAQANEGGSDWMRDWMGNQLAEDFTPGEISDWNTDDQWGLSRINFDGWRYIHFPLPGQYPGEGYHWPSNSQWNWTGDGIVHYPLHLKKLVIELPEKVLYLNRFEPPKRTEIRMRDLFSVENSDINNPKAAVDEYVEAAQHDIK